MFAAGSIKSSKWGWDVKGYTPNYDTSYTFSSTSGFWSPLTLAPNGFYYALPRVWYKSTGVLANDVLCFKPGNSNNKDNKWTPAQSILVPATGTVDNPGKQPLLPSESASALGGSQYRFPSKGVLAPNGKLYFFGMTEKYYVVLTPQEDPDANPTTIATQWQNVKYSTTNPQIDIGAANSGSFYSGGILGSDGYIYLIPSPTAGNLNFAGNTFRQRNVRIAPRNTAVNSTNIDIVELGYYNGSSASRIFNPAPSGPYHPGVDITGTLLTAPTNMSGSEIYGNSTTGNKLYGSAIANGITHPNGKTYLFGGASKRVYILDPTKWGTSSEIYTSNTLYFPNLLAGNPSRGWYNASDSSTNFGSGFTATLEKLKPGQDPQTLKIYFGFGGRIGASMTPTSINRKYTSTIVFDPVTEEFTSNLYNESTNEGLSIISAQLSETSSSSSFVNLPNGHIFQSIKNGLGSINPFGKLIYTKENSLVKYLGPTKRNILSTREINATQNYFNYAGADGNGSAIPGIGKSFGKTILSGAQGACEITSVKGFYPGIKYFDYEDNNNLSFNSQLKTHTGLVILSANQVRLIGVNLTPSLAAGSKFVLSGTNTGNDGSYTVSQVSLSGSDTIVTVTGNPFSPAYQDTIQGINVTSTNQFEFNCTYDQSQVIFNNDIIYIEGTDNNDYYVINGVSITFTYTSGPPEKGTITSSTPIFTPGNFTNGLVYYDNPLVESTAVFTYGQLVAFPFTDTLRIYGVDLTNSMYQVQYVNIQGSSASGNNGTKQIYTGSTPYYENGYTDLSFQGVSFTQLAPEAGVTISYDYAFNDSDIYDIPEDLSTLPTSLWNTYFNKPR
jgi:hypothetical protein